MDFYRIPPISINKVKLIPRPDLVVDGSYIAFDIVGDIDTTGLLARVISQSTVFKSSSGVIRLLFKCKYDQSDRRSYTVETYGVCSKAESDAMDEIYWKGTGERPICLTEFGGKRYTSIFDQCHPFASMTALA